MRPTVDSETDLECDFTGILVRSLLDNINLKPGLSRAPFARAPRVINILQA